MEHKSQLVIAIAMLLAVNGHAQELTQCLAVTDDVKRLACYDNVSGYVEGAIPAAIAGSAMVTKSIATKAAAIASQPLT